MPLHIVSPIHRKKRHHKRVGEGELLQISPITITVKKKWSTLNPPFHKLFNLRGTPLCGGGWERGRTEMLEYDNFANTHRNTHLIHIQLRIKQMKKKNGVSKGHPATPSNYEAANADQQYSFFK